MEFPDKEYRLLALFRLWNVVNYFFPYKNLTGSNWNDVLPKYIPQFESDKDAPTIRAIVEGSDEILDAAIKFLRSNR